MSKQNYQVVKFKHGKIVFEALFKQGCAQKVREGKMAISNATFADDVFVSPHQKGTLAKPADLSSAFPGKSGDQILQYIAENGEIQYSAEERKQQVEDKRRKIVEHIHQYYVDPATGKPHPVIRIENALTELRIVIDPEAPMEKELKEVEKRLNDVLPSKRMEMEVIVTIPTDFLKAADAVMKKFGKASLAEQDSSSKKYKLSIVPGDFDLISKELAKATRGNYQIDMPSGQKVQKSQKEGKGKKGKR